MLNKTHPDKISKKKKDCKILHITPHLGGGIGRVLLNYITNTKKGSFLNHGIVCLDYANEHALKVAKKIGFELHDNLFWNQKKLIKKISDADIVLIHWWNHPLLYDFLVRAQLPPCRLIIWSHISGFHAPYIFTEKILKYPDAFIFTTPVSFETKEVKKLLDKEGNRFRTVWSTGGVEHVKSVKPKKHPGFNIGYIGTVDYAKLHPNFLKICNKINIPNVKFIVCGGANEQEIKKEAKSLGIADKFIFTGKVADITKYLSIFDIFGYPLASYHYGTCDQSLQEAMAAGVVPVVLSNSMEKYMVKNGVSGIVAKDENDYIRAIQKLYNDKSLRRSLSQSARKYAANNFSLNMLSAEWSAIFREILSRPKTQKKWGAVKRKREISAADIFLESLGKHSKYFYAYQMAKNKKEKNAAAKKIKEMTMSGHWQSKSKGSVEQYCAFFPDNRYLQEWHKIIKK